MSPLPRAGSGRHRRPPRWVIDGYVGDRVKGASPWSAFLSDPSGSLLPVYSLASCSATPSKSSR